MLSAFLLCKCEDVLLFSGRLEDDTLSSGEDVALHLSREIGDNHNLELQPHSAVIQPIRSSNPTHKMTSTCLQLVGNGVKKQHLLLCRPTANFWPNSLYK